MTNSQACERVISHLEKRFRESKAEKHSNLIRVDIIQSIRSIQAFLHDATLLDKARTLIMEEKEEKVRKKLLAIL